MEYNYSYPHLVTPSESGNYTGDPDLLLLRESLADEIGSVIGYTEIAALVKDYRIGKTFRQIANDELNHFASLLQLITGFDPTQAEALKKQELMIMTAGSEEVCPYRSENYKNNKQDAKKGFYPDDPIWDFLQNAIKDELLSINAYQRQVKVAENPTVQGLFTNIMNKEKEHFVTFTKIFYEVYGLHPESLVL